MLFHIIVIEIWWELNEIEFAKKNLQIFHLWAVFLPKHFVCTVESFLWEPNSAENYSFESRSFGLMVLGVDLVLEMDCFDRKWHSQIASITILHLLAKNITVTRHRFNGYDL